MRDLVSAAMIAEEFTASDDEPLQEVIRLLRAANRKTFEIEEAALTALELLSKMRWREWPKGTCEALGLESIDEMDEVMIELDRALAKGRRSTPKKRNTNMETRCTRTRR